MSVQKDDSGRRWIEVETEVPGTPEQVWQAIATGPGVSSWFVPTEKRDDGTVVSHFGPGMDAIARETAYDPLRRFAAESEVAPGVAMATEWILEAHAGGSCRVRVVHSVFADTDDWDNQLESIEGGWPGYFRLLRLYLTHFAGWPCTPFQLIAMASGTAAEAWAIITNSLGIEKLEEGQPLRTKAGAPPLAGVVEQAGDEHHGEGMLLRLEEPTPGMAHLFAFAMGGPVIVVARVYLYGDQAPSAAAQAEPQWQAWLHQHFPPITDPGAVCS